MLETREVFWSAGYSPAGSVNWNWCDAHNGSRTIPKQPYLIRQEQKEEDALVESCVTVDFSEFSDTIDSFRLRKSSCARQYPFICQVIICRFS
jgi:hypothetical protein